MMDGSAIRTGACLLWSANPRGSRIELARQFALRRQLSANTHDMPEVRPVRPKEASSEDKSWMAGHRRAEATPSFGRLCPAMTGKSRHKFTALYPFCSNFWYRLPRD